MCRALVLEWCVCRAYDFGLCGVFVISVVSRFVFLFLPCFGCVLNIVTGGLFANMEARKSISQLDTQYPMTTVCVHRSRKLLQNFPGESFSFFVIFPEFHNVCAIRYSRTDNQNCS